MEYYVYYQWKYSGDLWHIHTPYKKMVRPWSQFFLLRLPSAFQYHRLRSIHSCMWTSPESFTLLPHMSPPSILNFSWESSTCQYSTETSYWSPKCRSKKSAPSHINWPFAVIKHYIVLSQIKVSSISLSRGVKLDLLTSWMQQPGVEMVMTATVRGSIQLRIFFSPLWWKG